MKEWIDNFYGSPATRQALEESFAPLFTELGAGTAAIAASEVGLPAPVVAAFVQSMLQTHVENYLSSSRAQLTELLDGPDPKSAIQQRMAEWIEKRPGKVANETTYKTSNAVTQTVYRDAGVTRKKWSARGKSCPYCKRMNGKVVDIERPFHREGDSIDVPDAEIAAKAKLNFTHEIGHPPQHQGCDCVIEADFGLAPGAQPTDDAFARIRSALPNAELDLTGIHPDLAREVASAVEQMVAAFPRTGGLINRIELSSVRGGYAEVVTDFGQIGPGGKWIAGSGQSTIKLNRKLWADPDLLNEELRIAEVMGWGVPGASSAESVIVHEWGHIVDSTYPKIGMNRSYLIGHPDVISEYAASSFSERFAENFRAIYYTPRDKWTDQVRILDGLLRRYRGQ